MTPVVVPARYNGPPDSGNGGYVCGLVAVASGIPDAEVTLRRPPPLDTPLRLDDGSLYDGEHVVATVTSGEPVTLTPPPSPGIDNAREAERHYAGLHHHPFPTCYVCGPARDDGLGHKPGRIDDTTVATTWTPRDTDEANVWASLDCAGAWAFLQSDDAPIVLGRLAVRIDRRPQQDEPHVVVGWQAAPPDGRKRLAGTALYDQTGELLAIAKATWVALQSGER